MDSFSQGSTVLFSRLFFTFSHLALFIFLNLFMIPYANGLNFGIQRGKLCTYENKEKRKRTRKSF